MKRTTHKHREKKKMKAKTARKQDKPGISCQRETQPLPGVIMATTPLKDAVVYLSTMTSLSRAFVSASKKTQLLQPSWMNCSRVLRMWHRRHARRFFVLSGMTIARVGGLGFSVCGLFAMCLDVSDTRSITSKKKTHAFLFFFPLFSCFHSFFSPHPTHVNS